MGGWKFLRYGSFREVDRPAGGDDVAVAIGAVVVLDGERWCVVGVAPNPHRPGAHLAFVERVAPRPGEGAATAGPADPP